MTNRDTVTEESPLVHKEITPLKEYAINALEQGQEEDKPEYSNELKKLLALVYPVVSWN